MREQILALCFYICWVLLLIRYVVQDKKIYERVDGVESIDGITYLIKDTDVSYIMYKLNSTCVSKNIKEKEFEVLNENEGIITFGGVNYSLNLRGSENDMNIGAAYRIRCLQWGNDVYMKVTFEKRDWKWWSPDTGQPDFALNQAYHRFFKEIFDVQVVRQERE